MKTIKIEVTLQELSLLTTLMSDQLFRREFIDPKMPGYKSDPAEVRVGKDLVLRLKSLAQQAAGTAAASGTRRAASPLSPNSHGIPDAV